MEATHTKSDPCQMDTASAPKRLKTLHEQESSKRVIVILEAASLEIVKIGKTKDSKYQLLNCDDHQGMLKRHNKNIADYRPDITHQVKKKFKAVSPQSA